MPRGGIDGCFRRGSEGRDADHRSQEPSRARRVAVRRHAGLRGRPPRLPRLLARGRDRERAGPGGLEPQGLRIPRGRRGAADGEPEPLAPGAAQYASRPVPGRGAHLPGARIRPLEHDADRRRPRGDRHRPPDLRGSRPGGPRSLHHAPGRAAGHRRDLYPQPCRSLRRSPGRSRRGGRPRGPGRRDRAGPLHGGDRVRERSRARR
jgi:hypothetical protein